MQRLHNVSWNVRRGSNHALWQVTSAALVLGLGGAIVENRTVTLQNTSQFPAWSNFINFTLIITAVMFRWVTPVMVYSKFRRDGFSITIMHNLTFWTQQTLSSVCPLYIKPVYWRLMQIPIQCPLVKFLSTWYHLGE